MKKGMIQGGPSGTERADSTIAVSKRKKNASKKKKTELNAPGNNFELAEDEYLVESILGKKFKHGAPHYLVKWLGWPSSANTWEPIENLRLCMWMVDKYERAHGGEKSSIGEVKIKIEAPSSGEEEGWKPELPKATEDDSMIVFLEDIPALQENTGKTKGRYKNKPVKPSSIDDLGNDVASEEDDLEEVDIHVGVLQRCPPGKRLEKIHAVTIVDGKLQFLLQWKSKESDGLTIPPLAPTNSNIVAATSVNNKFPREVIQFYEERIRFSVSLETSVEEGKKASDALQRSKNRQLLELEVGQQEKYNGRNGDESDEDDIVTKAIEKARRKYDKFSLYDSDLSSSAEEDCLYIE